MEWSDISTTARWCGGNCRGADGIHADTEMEIGSRDRGGWCAVGRYYAITSSGALQAMSARRCYSGLWMLDRWDVQRSLSWAINRPCLHYVSTAHDLLFPFFSLLDLWVQSRSWVRIQRIMSTPSTAQSYVYEKSVVEWVETPCDVVPSVLSKNRLGTASCQVRGSIY